MPSFSATAFLWLNWICRNAVSHCNCVHDGIGHLALTMAGFLDYLDINLEAEINVIKILIATLTIIAKTIDTTVSHPIHLSLIGFTLLMNP